MRENKKKQIIERLLNSKMSQMAEYVWLFVCVCERMSKMAIVLEERDRISHLIHNNNSSKIINNNKWNKRNIIVCVESHKS